MTIVESIRAVGQELAVEDAESCQNRKLTDNAWGLLRNTGVLRALQPSRWGGGEIRLEEYVEAILELSSYNASAGWVAAVLGIHPWQLGLFSERAQEEMWGDDPTRIHSSSYTPTGRLEPVEGGFILSGRWSFSSGSQLCDAVVLGGMAGLVEIDGKKIPDVYSAILYPDQYRIEDTWHTAGLRGTGSQDIVVENIFVPEHRTQSHVLYSAKYGTELPGQEKNQGSLYRLPWAVVFTTVLASASVGASWGFVKQWLTEISEKPGRFDSPPLRDNSMMQHRAAETHFIVEGAMLRIREVARKLQEQVEQGCLPTEAERAGYRWALARSAQEAGRSITELFRAAGGRSAYIESVLHRKFQDVTAGLGHAFLFADPIGTTFGAKLLGSNQPAEVPL